MRQYTTLWFVNSQRIWSSCTLWANLRVSMKTNLRVSDCQIWRPWLSNFQMSLLWSLTSYWTRKVVTFAFKNAPLGSSLVCESVPQLRLSKDCMSLASLTWYQWRLAPWRPISTHLRLQANQSSNTIKITYLYSSWALGFPSVNQRTPNSLKLRRYAPNRMQNSETRLSIYSSSTKCSSIRTQLFTNSFSRSSMKSSKK